MIPTKIVSKMLVCDSDPLVEQQLKDFCDLNNLLPIRLPTPDALTKVLSSDI